MPRKLKAAERREVRSIMVEGAKIVGLLEWMKGKKFEYSRFESEQRLQELETRLGEIFSPDSP